MDASLRTLVDKLTDLAAKSRAIANELDRGALSNPVSDWVMDVESLRERNSSPQALTALCIGGGAREFLCALAGLASVRVSFEGSWEDLHALGPFALGEILHGSHFAVVSGAHSGDENLKALSEQLPAIAIDLSPGTAAPRVSSLRGSEGGNPQWVRSGVVLNADAHRSLLVGVLASRAIPIADAMRRGAQRLLVSDRVEQELKLRWTAFDAEAKRARLAVEATALEAEQQAVGELRKRQASARARADRFLEAVQNAERQWPRDLGDNPITEITTAVLEKVTDPLRNAYREITTRGAKVASSHGQTGPANMADLMYAPFARISSTDEVEFAASDAQVSLLVEGANAQAFGLTHTIVMKQVSESLRSLKADAGPVLDKLARDSRDAIEAGRTRRVRATIARAQAMKVPTSGFLTAIKWGYAAVRPYMFLILAGGAALAATGATGGDAGVPKVFLRLGIGLGLGLLVAALLFPGRARHERARLRNEFVERNAAAILEGLIGVVREIITAFAERASASLKENGDALDESLEARGEEIAKRQKSVADERKAGVDTDTARTGFNRDPRAALMTNCRDAEKAARAVFTDWARQFKVSP